MDHVLALGDLGQMEKRSWRPQLAVAHAASVWGAVDAPLGPRPMSPSGQVDPRFARRLEGDSFGGNVLGCRPEPVRQPPGPWGRSRPLGGRQKSRQAPPPHRRLSVPTGRACPPRSARAHRTFGLGCWPEKGQRSARGTTATCEKNTPPVKLCPRRRLGCPHRFLSSHPQNLGNLNYAIRTLWIL